MFSTSRKVLQHSIELTRQWSTVRASCKNL